MTTHQMIIATAAAAATVVIIRHTTRHYLHQLKTNREEKKELQYELSMTRRAVDLFEGRCQHNIKY